MTDSSAAPRILMVDDEPNALDGYRRALYGRFKVVTATSGVEGLGLFQQSITDGAPFPVVVSDMMMPGMNGAQFLSQVRGIDSTAVQLLLSGQADLDSTIAAVNNGNLFRFLTKPCAAPDLSLALAAAIEQHRLVGAERELLERTLTGAVDVLLELLEMASPEAFSRTEQVRALVQQTSVILGVDDWRLPLAAMLSQVGCVAVPSDVLRRARIGGALSPNETEVFRTHPQTARRLLGRIPRLEDVAKWVGDQPLLPDDPHEPVSEPAESLLRAVLGYLTALDDTGHPARALARLTVRGNYSQATLDAIAQATSGTAPQGVLKELTVGQVRPGMLLDADVETKTGMTLVRKGERVTEAVAIRLSNFARTVGVKEPIRVLDGI